MFAHEKAVGYHAFMRSRHHRCGLGPCFYHVFTAGGVKIEDASEGHRYATHSWRGETARYCAYVEQQGASKVVIKWESDTWPLHEVIPVRTFEKFRFALVCVRLFQLHSSCSAWPFCRSIGPPNEQSEAEVRLYRHFRTFVQESASSVNEKEATLLYQQQHKEHAAKYPETWQNALVYAHTARLAGNFTGNIDDYV